VLGEVDNGLRHPLELAVYPPGEAQRRHHGTVDRLVVEGIGFCGFRRGIGRVQQAGQLGEHGLGALCTVFQVTGDLAKALLRQLVEEDAPQLFPAGMNPVGHGGKRLPHQRNRMPCGDDLCVPAGGAHCIEFHSCRASSNAPRTLVFRKQVRHSNQKRVVPPPTCTLAAGGVPQVEQGLIGLIGSRDSGHSLGMRACLAFQTPLRTKSSMS
jgi:hypothetical protein